MPSPLSGPGLGLPLPQYLVPSQLNNAPVDVGTNRVSLAPGDMLPLPAGDWYVNPGQYCVIQFKDPVTGLWNVATSAGWMGGSTFVKSDGFNVRVANLLGCPVSATVVTFGSGYVQGTTTITQTGGTGTWSPIVGGALAVVGGTLTSNGAGYGVAPLVLIPPPPGAANNSNGVGGIPATAFATIASGTVSGISFTNPGAGYPTAPTGVIVPNPTDPNLATGITAATVAFSLTGSGQIRGAFCTNPGAPLTSPANVTLTVAGAGTQATLTPHVMQTVTAISMVGSATNGYGVGNPGVTSVGGAPATGTITNGPENLYLAFRPRPTQGALTITGTGSVNAQVGTIYDGGLFLSVPTPVVAVNPIASGSFVGGSTVTFVMGVTNDIVTLQPAP